MGKTTEIAWCDHTFNAWLGCSKVSPACENCYAEKDRAVAAASARKGLPLWGPNAERVVTSDAYWRQPLKWHREAVGAGVRRRVFCSSLADVFEDRRDLDKPRARLWALIEETPGLDWLLLTKRPQHVERLAPERWFGLPCDWPEHAWLGTTVEDQARAEERIPHLLNVEGPRVKFLSCEPLLGPVELPKFIRLYRPVGSDVVWLDDHKFFSPGGRQVAADSGLQRVYLNPNGARSVLVSCPEAHVAPNPCDRCDSTGKVALGIKPDECEDMGIGISWLICGGESGAAARPMHPDWARSLRDQCLKAGVPYFFKQVGAWAPRQRDDGKPFDSFAEHNRDRLVTFDGNVHTTQEAAGDNYVCMSLVGKKAAGDLLDGVRHQDWPS